MGYLNHLKPSLPYFDINKRLIFEAIPRPRIYFLYCLLPKGIVARTEVSVSSKKEDIKSDSNNPISEDTIPRLILGKMVKEPRAFGKVIAIKQWLDKPGYLFRVGGAIGV
jgi:hypothetical protein